MSGTADPWEPPSLPALSYSAIRTPDLRLSGGPERIYDDRVADRSYEPPRIRSFTAPVLARLADPEPRLWAGDQA